MIEALRGLEAELNEVKPPLYAAYPHPIHLNVGMIRGGDWPSTVAGECVTHFRLATYPGEPVAALKARVEATVASVASGSPLRFDVVYDGFQCEGYELEPDAPLVGALAEAAAGVIGRGAAAVRVDRHHRRALLPALRRHAGRLLRPARGKRARSRRAREPAVDAAHRPGDRAVHRRLVRSHGLTSSSRRSRIGAASGSNSNP